jgi:hypothetical protein
LEPCWNGTTFFDGFDHLDSVDKIKDKVLERTDQASYCTAERSFCFFSYDDGQVPPVNGLDSTNVPTELWLTELVTSAPEPSSGETALPDQNDNQDPVSPPPTVAPETAVPTKTPTLSTNMPTTSVTTPEPTSIATALNPTPNPTSEPTLAPVEEPPPDSSPDDGEGGSDGFDMDEIGSDGFNPNDLFA